ncbi:MAG TPA: holo-ACP synthase [Candidatus Limnocylindrales bacterium]|nr:holo-ACP synthase [Candidatus Limnocylindrales bacterium]
MIYGIGIDVVRISRLEEVINRRGKRFLERVFTPREIEYCSSKALKIQHYAVRFAVKEAVFKAFGTGWSRGVTWHDVEVFNDEGGRPQVKLSGKCQELAGELQVKQVLISLSHDGDYAIAQALIEC